MAYISPNLRSKKAIKEALAKGESIRVFQPGLGAVPVNGEISLEGPHYPEPHKWYATGHMKDGKLVRIE